MPPRQFLVKSDNVYVPDHLRGTQVITLDGAPTAEALHTAIVERYGWREYGLRLELWTNPMGFPRVRVDEISGELPTNIDTIFFRARMQRLRQDTGGDGNESSVLHLIL